VSIEPDYYMPVIPMVLVNGSDGIGTGWSSKIPNYNPRQIISNIRNMINGDPLQEMHPYYSGFTGTFTPDQQAGKYACQGIIERTDDQTLVISELPVRYWTQDCKNVLEKMLVSNDKSAEAEIRDFVENHTDTTVSFTITAAKEKIDAWERLPKGGLYAKFKLISSVSTTNMNLYNTDHKIVKHAKPEGILESFFQTRMMFYIKRKQLMVKNLRKEQNMLSNKARFVEEVCSGSLVVNNRKKVELLEDLQTRGYDLFEKNTNDNNDDSDDEDEDSPSTSDLSKGYEYLLGMKLWNLTYEKVEDLRKQLAERTAELEKLESTEPSQIWVNDLDAIEVALDERDKQIEQAEQDEIKAQKKTAQRQATKGKKKAPAKRRVTKKKKDVLDEEVEAVMSKKPAASRGRKPAAKKTPEINELIDDDEDDLELTLFERLKLSKTVSADSSESSTSGTKRPSPKASATKASSTKRAKASSKSARKKPTTKRNQLSDEEEGFLCESDSESDMEVEVVPAPRPRRTTRATRAKTKPTYTVDDEDSFMADSDDDSDF